MTDNPPEVDEDPPILLTDAHREQVARWRRMAAFAGACVIVLFAIVIFGFAQEAREDNEDEKELACRNQLIDAVAAADQVERDADREQDIARDSLVIIAVFDDLSPEGQEAVLAAAEVSPTVAEVIGAVDPGLAAIKGMAEAIVNREIAATARREASNARQDFAEDPDGDC